LHLIVFSFFFVKDGLKLSNSSYFFWKDCTFVLQEKVMGLLLITFILLLVAFAGIAIKIWAKKDGKFAGTCASQSPFLNKDGHACGFCGKTPDQFSSCTNDHKKNS